MACGDDSAEQTFTAILADTTSFMIRESMPLRLTLESSAGRLSFTAADKTMPDDADAPTLEAQDELIGMTVAEAEAYAAANNTTFRIGSIDGEFMAVTMDYRPGRITASVEKGVVVDYTVE